MLTKKSAEKNVSKETKTENKYKDIVSLERKVEKLKKHLEKNKHDYKTKRALQIKEAKLNKLKKYIKRKKEK